MNWVVRLADLTRDGQIIINLHKRFLSTVADQRRFEWLYLDNPVGQPKTWIISDSTLNRDIGTAAAFPRLLLRRKEKVLGWVLGDFCISDRYRTLGPAIVLQKACLEGVGWKKSSLWYDFPSSAMLAVYKRLHITSTFSMVRLAKPLRVERIVQSFVKNKFFVKGISCIGNRILDLNNRKPFNGVNISISLQQGDCGEEFTELFEQCAEKWGICGYRSNSFLNWRYVKNPLNRYYMYVARRKGEICAYLVLTRSEHDASIVDLFGLYDFKLLRALIRWVLRELIKEKVTTVSVSIYEKHPMVPIFRNLGFKVRETCPLVISSSDTQEGGTMGQEWLDAWCLMHGDRDS